MVLHVVRVALHNLIRRPGRSLLVLQGVIWGSAIGIVPPAVVTGSLQRAERDASKIGVDRVVISREGGGELTRELVDTLRAEYGDRIESIAGVSVVAAEEDVEETAAEGAVAFVLGDERSFAARGLAVAEGRLFDAADVESARPVGVLEARLAEQLFPDGAVGQRMMWSERSIEIVGVCAPRPRIEEGIGTFGYRDDHPLEDIVSMAKDYLGVVDDPSRDALDSDQALILPWTLEPDSELNWIEARARPRAILSLKAELRERLLVEGLEPMIYTHALLPVLYGETIRRVQELNQVVFVVSIATGTSVVCAIMILAVMQRRREIAIRRVEGARRWHIALQFIVETGTVCGVGGVLGIPLGLGLAWLRCALEPLAGADWTFPPVAAATVVSVVTIVGLIGGLLPAWRAVNVDPVEVLRHG